MQWASDNVIYLVAILALTLIVLVVVRYMSRPVVPIASAALVDDTAKKEYDPMKAMLAYKEELIEKFNTRIKEHERKAKFAQDALNDVRKEFEDAKRKMQR